MSQPKHSPALTEGPLQTLIQQIYNTQHADDHTVLSGDDFRIFGYKVIPCSKTAGHDWTACPFAHANEKAARRCPVAKAYCAIACPDMKRAGECPRGESCMFAHNVFEYWLHPSRYRTQLCSYGLNCRRSVCFFAHHPGELRVVDKSPQLVALENQFGAVDSAFGLPGNAGGGMAVVRPGGGGGGSGGARPGPLSHSLSTPSRSLTTLLPPGHGQGMASSTSMPQVMLQQLPYPQQAERTAPSLQAAIQQLMALSPQQHNTSVPPLNPQLSGSHALTQPLSHQQAHGGGYPQVQSLSQPLPLSFTRAPAPQVPAHFQQPISQVQQQQQQRQASLLLHQQSLPVLPQPQQQRLPLRSSLTIASFQPRLENVDYLNQNNPSADSAGLGAHLFGQSHQQSHQQLDQQYQRAVQQQQQAAVQQQHQAAAAQHQQQQEFLVHQQEFNKAHQLGHVQLLNLSAGGALQAGGGGTQSPTHTRVFGSNPQPPPGALPPFGASSGGGGPPGAMPPINTHRRLQHTYSEPMRAVQEHDPLMPDVVLDKYIGTTSQTGGASGTMPLTAAPTTASNAPGLAVMEGMEDRSPAAQQALIGMVFPQLMQQLQALQFMQRHLGPEDHQVYSPATSVSQFSQHGGDNALHISSFSSEIPASCVSLANQAGYATNRSSTESDRSSRSCSPTFNLLDDARDNSAVFARIQPKYFNAVESSSDADSMEGLFRFLKLDNATALPGSSGVDSPVSGKFNNGSFTL